MKTLAKTGAAIYVLAVSTGAPTLAATVRVPAEYPTIQEGIDATATGDTALVANGVYRECEITFDGKDIVLRSEQGPRFTIIDASGCSYCSCVRFDHGETEAAVLEGFTITGGPDGWVGGGAIFCESSSPTIAGCLLAGNVSWQLHGGYGAAILATISSSPTIVRCTVTANNADTPQGGGGLCSRYSSSVTVVRSIFWGNYGGDLIACDSLSTITALCCAVDPVGCGGEGQVEFLGESIFEDPRFCSPRPAGLFVADPEDFCLWGDSPCLPWNSPCGELIGALGIGCPAADAARPSADPLEERLALVGSGINGVHGKCTLTFSLPVDDRVRIAVYDVQGHLVDVLADGFRAAGTHQLVWSTGGLAARSGVYYALATTERERAVQPLVLIR